MVNPKDLLQDSIEKLGHNIDFAILLEYIRQNREAAISDLYGGSNEKMIRASGEIKAMDELLRTVDYETVQKRWGDVLKAKKREES